MSVKASRKLLKEERKEESTNFKDGQYLHRRAKEDPKSFATPKNIGIVVTGTFVVLCCGVLCPCFYRKRRHTVQRALEKEQSGESSVLSEFFDLRDNRSIVTYKFYITHVLSKPLKG